MLEETTTETGSDTMAASAMVTSQAQGSASKAPIFEQLTEQAGAPAVTNDIDLILDIPVQLTVELGRTRIPLQ